MEFVYLIFQNEIDERNASQTPGDRAFSQVTIALAMISPTTKS